MDDDRPLPFELPAGSEIGRGSRCRVLLAVNDRYQFIGITAGQIGNHQKHPSDPRPHLGQGPKWGQAVGKRVRAE